MNLRKKIARMRRLLVDATDLGDVHDYFHEALAGDPAFIRIGKRGRSPRLLGAVEAALRHVGASGPLSEPIVMLRVPKHGMWHGFACAGGGIAIFLYFEDLDTGLCCYSGSLADPAMVLSRFALVELSRPALPGPVRRGVA
jgi:hypothetical protein